MSVFVRQLNPSDHTKWDQYVIGHPQGSPFHLIAWKKSIEQTFGFRAIYLLAADGDRICGVLPLFLVENFLMGRALLSSPFAVYGGILADSPEVSYSLAHYVRSLADFFQVEYVELRNAYREQCVGFSSVSRYVNFTQRIGPDEDGILKAIPRKTRAAVRKALQQSFTSRIQKTDFKAFEELYSANLRKLGTPSFPPRHFGTLLENFGGQADIREIIHQGKVVAAVFTFYFRDQVLPYYGASDPRYNSLAPNNYMYFDVMREAGRAGFRTFDFGRSKRASGSYDFKSYWGMEERELPYEMLLVNKKELPNFSPLNPRFRLPIKIWQNLPLPVTRALGPSLVRLVP